jgi:hypothetical protein
VVADSAADTRAIATAVATEVDLVLMSTLGVEPRSPSVVGADCCEPGFLVFEFALAVVAGAPPVVFVGQSAGGQRPDGGVSGELSDLLPGGVEVAAGGGDVAFEPGEVRVGVVGVGE